MDVEQFYTPVSQNFVYKQYSLHEKFKKLTMVIQFLLTKLGIKKESGCPFLKGGDRKNLEVQEDKGFSNPRCCNLCYLKGPNTM